VIFTDLPEACMRLRKLGLGQPVVFYDPEEIKSQLLLRKKTSGYTTVRVSNVLCWAIKETWLDIRRSMPLWALQGRCFQTQHELWNAAPIEAYHTCPKLTQKDSSGKNLSRYTTDIDPVLSRIPYL
jgi:hypothetical protein